MKALHVYIGLVLVTFGISCFLIKAEFNIRHLEKEVHTLKCELCVYVQRDCWLLTRIHDVAKGEYNENVCTTNSTHCPAFWESMLRNIPEEDE